MKRFPLILITLALLIFISATSWAKERNFREDELLVYFVPKNAHSLDQEIISLDGAVAGSLPQIHVKKIKVKNGQAREKIKARLLKSKKVVAVEENFLAEPLLLPNDAYYGNQWHLGKIEAPAAWDITTGSAQMPIAIIDSGIDLDHPDLAQKILPGFNFLDDSTNGDDVYGHGTAVAGAATAISDNLTGVSGVSWQSPVVPLVVLNGSNYATYYDMARAIIWAADHGIKVINISLGGSSSSTTLQNAVNYAWGKGCLIFASAANANTSTKYYPAACNNVVSVAATDKYDKKASFSNYGDWIDITAPGHYIYTTKNGGSYGYYSGTSFSSPISAGLAALIWSAHPELTNTAVQTIIEENSDDLGAAGFDAIFGHGRINAFKSVMAAATLAGGVPPHVAISSPTEGMKVSGAVEVAIEASDDEGVELVELYVNGVLVGTDASSPYLVTWNAPKQDGIYELTAKAYDTDQNASSSSISVVVPAEADPDSTVPAIDPTGTYIEAENFTASMIQGVAYYTVESSQSGFNGSGYLKAHGASYETPPTGEGKEYRVYFPEAGNYNFWVRGQGFAGTSDSLYFGLNGQAQGALSPPVGGWVWSNAMFWNTNQLVIPAAGEYTVNVFVREGDFLLDGIYLSKGSETPSGGIPSGAAVIDPRNASTTADTSAPTVSFSSPRNGAEVSGAIAVEVEAADNTGVTQVELLVNGSVVATDTSAPFAFNWDVPELSGTYQLTAKASDAAKNIGTAEISVTVSEVSASLPAVDPNGTYIEAENFSDSIIQGTAYYTVESSQSGFNGTGYLKAHGASYETPPTGEGKEYRIYFPEAGSYNFWVRGQGFAGTSDSLYFGLNGQAKGALSPPIGGWVWSNTMFWNTNQLVIPAEGEYTVNVFVREGGFLLDGIYLTKGSETPSGGVPSGATVINPSNLSTSIDTTPPVVRIQAPGHNAEVSGTVSVAIDATDDTGVSQVELLVDGQLMDTDTSAPYSFSWVAPIEPGTYHLTARAFDDAQNMGAVTISVVIPETTPLVPSVDSAGTYFEAENFTSSIFQGSAYYTLETAKKGFSGSAYLKANGSSYETPPTGEGKKYRVYFPEAGTYRFWVRGLALSGTSDSVYFGLDGQALGALSFPTGDWVWSNRQYWNGNQLSIPAPGEYTVNVFIREKGFLLDGIYLTKGGETPSGGIPSGARVIDPR